ncbi:transcriptional initiation protein Tat [Vibrio nigripulchritudo]|uniref:transcriptional initiation protein Tat n=1 Tax=Vibrio nigripulchritudo TaxID=28173 RepID=UPI0024919D1C|nr:transcriptional initiation protein Tat [Vibrio nigripulchritudo]BDU37223.1 transcriptional initiation protein Tat [Vibrio nigripulchritudo]BDU42943.1 transcriptional initiation protein Tat [Vibrio nigripulchritudo]
MKDKQAIDPRRRNLLKGMTTVTVAGTLAAGTSKVAAAEETQPEVTESTTGYKETQHIRDYYDTL